MIDRTGQPRRNEEIQEAIDAVLQIMIKQPLVLPLFTVHAGIILDCLRELQDRRAKNLPEIKILKYDDNGNFIEL